MPWSQRKKLSNRHLELRQRKLKIKIKEMKKLLCLLAILMPMLSANCYADYVDLNQLKEMPNNHCQHLRFDSGKQQLQFQNLKGLSINIVPTESEYSQSENFVSLSNSDCFAMPTVSYIQRMGFFDLGENDYNLNIYLNTINVYLFKGSPRTDVVLQIEMTNRYNEVIFRQIVSSYSAQNWTDFYLCLDEAYTLALEKINWYKIASFLKEGSAPKQQVKQKSKEVKGYGNTALESTIVRWDVQSRPQGADVFWRVVSKTPSVKSTNNKYLQTTPYEATKSLDIRGLSYENSGDVRIILRCEKEGYYPQEKEFNVRMIIDQEEISAFFKLVKEE